MRAQIAQIAIESLGPDTEVDTTWTQEREPLPSYPTWETLQRILCREYGRDNLINALTPMLDVLLFFRNEATTGEALDVIELLLRFTEQWAGDLQHYERKLYKIRQAPEDAIAEVNLRLRRAGCGYQYESGCLIRLDSQYTHSQAIVPALRLLSQPGLDGAEKEFREAHRHYRASEHEQAIFQGGKAFESTLKAICDAKDWSYPTNATAIPLLDIVLNKNLLPAVTEGQLHAIRATLEQGPPAIRNSQGGHGAGSSVRHVPDYMVAYMLNITASAIVMLVSAAGLAGLPNPSD